MTKHHEARNPSRKGSSSAKSRHNITPTQAEFLMDVRKHQIRHREGPTGKDLSNVERSLVMVRKLAMALSKADPAYLVSQTSSGRTKSGKQKRTATFTRYYLTEQEFVRWPRTARFLLECRSFPRDENANVSKEQFAEHLKSEHGFTNEKFQEDWDYVLERKYITVYPSGFSPSLRIEAELQWLELLAREHQPQAPQEKS
jgi:hypothetical protein